MEYRKAAEQDATQIYQLVQTTIITIYPKYYPKEVVDFFCALHNEAAIRADIQAGNVGVLYAEGQMVGTGSYQGNHITRVYVLPQFQGKGYGSFIMEQLESQIRAVYETAELDASLPASALYEKRGYKTIRHARWNVENGVVLVYEIMEKEFHAASTQINYDGRRFIPKVNSENGEVDGQTLFTYHQNGSVLWAEYKGGEVLRGTLVGIVSQEGSLDFVYHHLNTSMQLRMGKCHSTPRVLTDGKLELQEEWQWLSGDCSRGTSLLEEV